MNLDATLISGHKYLELIIQQTVNVQPTDLKDMIEIRIKNEIAMISTIGIEGLDPGNQLKEVEVEAGIEKEDSLKDLGQDQEK